MGVLSVFWKVCSDMSQGDVGDLESIAKLSERRI